MRFLVVDKAQLVLISFAIPRIIKTSATMRPKKLSRSCEHIILGSASCGCYGVYTCSNKLAPQYFNGLSRQLPTS